MGITLLFTSFFLLLSFLSYLSHGPADQSVVSAFLDVSINESGRSCQLIWSNGCISGALFYISLVWCRCISHSPIPIRWALQLWAIMKYLKSKKFFIFTIFYLIWLTLLLGYIVINFDVSETLGFLCGGIGYEMAGFINSLLGWGTGFFILFLLAAFNVYFFQYHTT